MSDKTKSEESISFLLAQICKAHRDRVEVSLAAFGLHAGQDKFLWHLWQQDGLTQSELAGSMCVQPPTVNKMLSRMESAGLVERRVDAEDNRISRVFLTEHSRQLQQAVEPAWSALEAQTVANLSDDEQGVLRRLLAQVYQNLTAKS